MSSPLPNGGVAPSGSHVEKDDPMQGSGGEEEGEGDVIEQGRSIDSSEEDEEDEEEERKIREGFIVDEDEEEEEEDDEDDRRRRKRRKRRHHRRREYSNLSWMLLKLTALQRRGGGRGPR